MMMTMNMMKTNMMQIIDIDNSELNYTEKNICLHVGKNNIISRSREYLCRKISQN